MEKRWYIYTLSDPISGEIRYVGKTGNPQSRLNQHISSAKNGKNTHCAKWIRHLLANGRAPNMDIIEYGDDDTWVDVEKQWIARFRAENVNLTNITDGGEGTEGYVVQLKKVCNKCGNLFIAHSEKSEYCDICCTFECIECGKTFYTRTYSRKNHPPLFCSSECYGKGKLPVWKKCMRCGKDFTTKSNRTKYCAKCKEKI